MREFNDPGKTNTKMVVCKQALPHWTAAGAATLSRSPWVTAARNMLHNSAMDDYGKKPCRGTEKKKELDKTAHTLIKPWSTPLEPLQNP